MRSFITKKNFLLMQLSLFDLAFFELEISKQHLKFDSENLLLLKKCYLIAINH